MAGANISDRSRRIARNTVLLYFRMAIMLLVGLYTSRVVLNALGQEDYGTYGAVGGVVGLFGILTGSMAGAISRFLAFELGKAQKRMEEVFSTTVFIQIGLAVIIFILSEVLGVWFLNSKMVIPDGRMEAANWVLQCSILVFVINLMAVPYNAAIIAHEKMEAFAYISIAEAVLALGAAIATKYAPTDKLKLYAILMLAVALLVRLLYTIYAKRHFPECHPDLKKVRRPMIKEMGSFAGWTFLGNGASVLNAQGVNILLNLFFGVRVNAARDLSVKLESNMNRFINNITTAINPQLNKSYAAGSMDYMHELICKGARYSYMLYFFFAFPIILEAPELLRIWLGNVPGFAVEFVRISMISSLFVAMGTPFANAIFASGNVKKYEIVASATNILAFPLSYLAFKLGGDPTLAYWMLAGATALVFVERVAFACAQTGLGFRKIWADVLVRSLLVTLVAAILPLALFLTQEPSLARTLEVVVASFAATAVSAYLIGATSGERQAVNEWIKKLF